MDIPNSNKYRLAVGTAELDARLREFAREVPVVYLRHGLPVAEGIALGNLREAMRIRAESERVNARAADYESHGELPSMSGGSRDRSPGKEKEDYARQPYRSWKWRRDNKWRHDHDATIWVSPAAPLTDGYRPRWQDHEVKGCMAT